MRFMAADFIEAAKGGVDRVGATRRNCLIELKTGDGRVPVRRAAATFQVSVAYIYRH